MIDTVATVTKLHGLCLHRICGSFTTHKNTHVPPGPCEKHYDGVLGDKGIEKRGSWPSLGELELNSVEKGSQRKGTLY